MENLRNVSIKEFKIKRGLKISSKKEAIYYALNYLEDNLKVFESYLLDWVDWLEDKEEEAHILSLIEWSDEENLKDFENSGMKIEKGFCKQFINNIYSIIEECKKSIVDNKQKHFIKKLKLLKNMVENSWFFHDIYCSHSYLNPYGDEDCGFYFLTPILVPELCSIRNIVDITRKIYETATNTYYKWSFDYYSKEVHS